MRRRFESYRGRDDVCPGRGVFCIGSFLSDNRQAAARQDKSAVSNHEPDETPDWLRDRGFGFVVEERDGAIWAHLTRLSSNDIVPRDYRTGDSPADAIERARSRYETEQ